MLTILIQTSLIYIVQICYNSVNEFSTQQVFAFDDGSSGYMLEGHLFEDSDTLIVWLPSDSFVALSLYYDGNRSVFNDNEELILRIARTLTDWD